MNCQKKLTLKQQRKNAEAYIHFISKMPLTEEQQMDFTKSYVNILQKNNSDAIECKEHYESKVLTEILNQ